MALTPRRSYERSLVFMSTAGDSLFRVPWILEATTVPGGIDRSARGWLARGGTWEPFLRDIWTSPPLQEPWRVLPHGPFRILVGDGDRLDRVFYDGGGRQLEVSLDETVVEWAGSRGGSFNLLEGALVLGDRQIPGWVLDVAQGIRVEEGALGDWLFVTSGDSLAAVIQAPLHTGDGTSFQGWAWDGADEVQWPDVAVAWPEQRAFEPARRNIPAILTVQAPGEEVRGELRVLSFQLETRPGPGPVLPVDGIMDVTGVLSIRGREYPVRGILRHRQP